MPKSRNNHVYTIANYQRAVYNSSYSNTVNETILETKLQFYILLMSVRDSGRTLNVDENWSIGASSSAAAVFKRRLSSQLFIIALTQVGVVVARRSAKFVDVALFNSSITHQKVLQQVGRCSVDDLAALVLLVTVD